jgi:hypothetical protein
MHDACAIVCLVFLDGIACISMASCIGQLFRVDKIIS